MEEIKNLFAGKNDHKEYILWCAFATMSIYKAITGKDAVENNMITRDFYEDLKTRYRIDENKITEILMQIRKLIDFERK